MEESLIKQSEELEQTLQQQLELLKQDSKGYLKVGGMAILVGLAAVGAVKLFFPGKQKIKPALDKISKKKDKVKHKVKKKKFSIFGNIKNRLFWMLMDYGKGQFMEMLIRKNQGGRGKK